MDSNSPVKEKFMATKTQSTVVAVFRTEADAKAAADDLKANGFSSNEIFMSSEAPAGRERGMEGTNAGRHEEGGIAGWFKHLFGSEDDRAYSEERPYYEKAAGSGHCFVSVDVDDANLDAAADVLNKHEPIDMQRDTGETGRTRTRAGRAQKETGRAGETKSVPVVQEELQVGKRAVLRGGVRVYSRVVEEPVEENLRLREERVRVERTPANRATTEGDLRPGQERVFEVKEYTEEPVVSKMSRVVEDVRIRKDATERTETVKDTVRRTEVDVENLSDPAVRARAVDNVGRDDTSQNIPQGNYDEDFRRNFSENYAARGENYETYAPAYRYGYEMAGNSRYQGRNFDEVEPDLRADYGSRYPNSTWERMKDSVRYGWDKLTRKI